MASTSRNTGPRTPSDSNRPDWGDFTFRTKTATTLEQAQRAVAAGVAVDWAAGDEVYGRSAKLRGFFTRELSAHRPTLECMSTPPPSAGLSLAAVVPIVETCILVDTVEILCPGPWDRVEELWAKVTGGDGDDELIIVGDLGGFLRPRCATAAPATTIRTR
ncbi:hypothetical protein ACWD7C_25075 [Streptomyces sp. NPDC005134]